MYAKISPNYSPNFSTPGRIKKNIKFIIFHYTGMKSESKAISRLTNVKSKVSCHYLIKKNGSVILIVPENYIAWHAGKSYWKKYSSINNYSIGIEIQNKGHQHGYHRFSNSQIKSLIKISKYLVKKYNINKKNILGHSDIAYERKKDPGEKFPWEYLAKNQIGIWHNLNKKKLIKLRNIRLNSNEERKIFNLLEKIGYSNKKNSSKRKSNLLKAFQRRFRPELVNGKIDCECIKIAEKVSKL